MAKHKKHDTEPEPTEPAEGLEAFDAVLPAPPEPVAPETAPRASAEPPAATPCGDDDWRDDEGGTVSDERPGAIWRHGRHERGTGLTFVRAGAQLVNLAHLVAVELPVEGDPKKPLTLKFVTGANLQLAGADADAVMHALGACCDLTPHEPDGH